MSDAASIGKNGVWQKIGVVIAGGALAMTAVGALTGVLIWIYGELNGIRESLFNAKVEIAEMRATVGALVKTVDKVDAKLDAQLDMGFTMRRKEP